MRRYLLYVAAGYLSGSVLFARLACALVRRENAIEQSKDGNPGVFNAFSYGGFGCGVLTLVGDLLKGMVPVGLYLRHEEALTPVALALVLVAPVVGHAFPCFYHFRGGKGIAVSFGCLLGLVPVWTPVLLFAGSFIFFSVVVCVTPHFQRTLITYAVTLLLMVLSHQPSGVVYGYAAISAVVGLRLHMSREPREPMQVRLPEGRVIR